MWMQPGGIMLALLRLPTIYLGALCSALVVVWYPHVSLRYLK